MTNCVDCGSHNGRVAYDFHHGVELCKVCLHILIHDLYAHLDALQEEYNLRVRSQGDYDD